MDGFIVCPNCKSQVPAGYGQCQFCQASLANVARPMQDKKGMFAYEDGHTQTYFGKPKWVEPVYTAICIYFIVGGLVSIAAAWLAVPSKAGEEMDSAFKIGKTIFGSIDILVGIGLLARVELVRQIVVFLCGLGILFGLIGLPGALMGTAAGFMGFLGFVIHLLDLITDAMMIYLIGETDKR